MQGTPTLQYFECRGLRKLNKHKKRQRRKQSILRGWRLLLNQNPQAESKFDKQNKCEIVNSYFINLNPNQFYKLGDGIGCTSMNYKTRAWIICCQLTYLCFLRDKALTSQIFSACLQNHSSSRPYLCSYVRIPTDKIIKELPILQT